jgi:hypothetical protein
MTKTDPALETIRKVRREISREFDNDPVRLVAHYMEMQRGMPRSRVVQGPDEDRDAATSGRDAAELGRCS